MSEIIPATTKVHRNRAQNVDTDRLQRRKDQLIHELKHGNDYFGRRLDFANKAYELHAIENVLCDRRAIHTSQNPHRHTERTYP